MLQKMHRKKNELLLAMVSIGGVQYLFSLL